MAKKIKTDLAHSLAEYLNKEIKNEGKTAYFLGDEETPTDVDEWVSTGSSILDLAISNKPNGGLPVGRIVEINGLESSGKSLVAAHVLATTQQKDGIAVYIDTENALSGTFLRSIGVDTGNMMYVTSNTVEQIFSNIERIISFVRDSEKNKLVTIVVDSLAAASTEAEMSGDYDKDGWATGKAIIISKAFRKITQLIGRERILLIFTNQLRQKLGVMFGDPWTTSGGKGLPFHASVRIRLKSVGQIKKKTTTIEEVVGIKIRAQIIKNRVGPPYRQADFDMFFDRGIDDSDNWLQILKDNDLISRSNPGFKLTDHNGEERKFRTEEWSNLLTSDNDLRNFLYDKICNIVIMKYKSESNIGISEEFIGGGDLEDGKENNN